MRLFIFTTPLGVRVPPVAMLLGVVVVAGGAALRIIIRVCARTVARLPLPLLLLLPPRWG